MHWTRYTVAHRPVTFSFLMHQYDILWVRYGVLFLKIGYIPRMAGSIDDYVVGPYEIQDRLGADQYAKFHEETNSSAFMGECALHVNTTTLLRRVRSGLHNFPGVEFRLPVVHVLPIWTLPQPRFYLWRCKKENVYAAKVWDYGYLINGIEVTAADIVPRQLVSVRGSNRRRLGRVFRRREGTLNICYDYAQYLRCTDNSESHEQNNTQKIPVMTEESYEGHSSLYSFIAGKEIS